MAGTKAESSKWPVPDDWNEEIDGFLIVVTCIPNSFTWRGIFMGQIADLYYGRNWNRHSGQISDAQDVARQIFEDTHMTCLDDLVTAVQCLCDNATIQTAQGEIAGAETEPQLSDGQISVGEGQQFEDTQSYFDAKCNVANAIHDTTLGVIQWLDGNWTGLLDGLLGGVTTGFVSGAVAAGPLGWAIAKISSVVVQIATMLISLVFDFDDVEDALVEQHEQCVLALFNASTAIEAETNFITEAGNGTNPLSAAAQQLLAGILSSEVTNQLFSPRGDVAIYQSADPIDCGSALLAFWTYPTDEEGWTFADTSTSPSSASGSYQLSLQALRVVMVNAGGGGRPRSQGTWTKTGLSIAAVAGGSAQMDYTANSDEITGTVVIRVTYSDVTFTEKSKITGGTAGTIVMTIPVTKTITDIDVSMSRTTSSSNTHSSEIEEVRIYGV